MRCGAAHGQETWGRAATTKSLEMPRGAAGSLRGASMHSSTPPREHQKPRAAAPPPPSHLQVAFCNKKAWRCWLVTRGLPWEHGAAEPVHTVLLGGTPNAARWHPSTVWWNPQCSEGGPAPANSHSTSPTAPGTDVCGSDSTQRHQPWG